MAKRYHGDYAGVDARRTEEMQDAGMIRENRSAVANLPQEVMYKPWPSAHEGLGGELNDDISGINKQVGEDSSGLRKHMGVHKW